MGCPTTRSWLMLFPVFGMLFLPFPPADSYSSFKTQANAACLVEPSGRVQASPTLCAPLALGHPLAQVTVFFGFVWPPPTSPRLWASRRQPQCFIHLRPHSSSALPSREWVSLARVRSRVLRSGTQTRFVLMAMWGDLNHGGCLKAGNEDTRK